MFDSPSGRPEPLWSILPETPQGLFRFQSTMRPGSPPLYGSSCYSFCVRSHSQLITFSANACQRIFKSSHQTGSIIATACCLSFGGLGPFITAKKRSATLSTRFAVSVSLLSIQCGSNGSIVAVKRSACFLRNSLDVHLVKCHVTNSKTTSAQGHTLNSILSRYCLISVILLSGPGVETLIGVCSCHEM